MNSKFDGRILPKDIFLYISRMLQGESARTRDASPRTDDLIWLQTHSFCFQLFDPNVHKMLPHGVCG